MKKFDGMQKELFDIFIDQFVDHMPLISSSIDQLGNTNTARAAINELFRIFHGLKANSLYFHLNPFIEVSQKAEKVLSSLRDEQGLVQEEIIAWLKKIEQQCLIWIDEIEASREEFSSIDQSILASVFVESSDEKPSEILKKLTILYFDSDIKRSQKIVKRVDEISSAAYSADSIGEFEKSISSIKPNIVIVNNEKEVFKAFQLCSRLIPASAFIAVLNHCDGLIQMRLGVSGVYHSVANPIRMDELKREIIAVIDSHFRARRYIIDSKKIKDFILGLKPIPTVIMKISQLCDNPESSLKDIISMVKGDPIISGLILKAALSPILGLHEVHTVDHAVTLFGKNRVKAIVLRQMTYELPKVELDIYLMDYEKFTQVASLRLALMIKWYSKISISKLEILSTTAILGNIGQLLLCQEIINMNKADEFARYRDEKGIQYAEERCAHTTTAYVSSDILSHWHLERDVVDALRFSDHPQHAPSEIQDLAIANHIVYRLIDLQGNIADKISDDIRKILLDAALDIKSLEKALAFIREISSTL